MGSFLPALLIAAVDWPQTHVAAAGAVYLVGCKLYRQAYVADPAKRGLGFVLTFLPTTLLALAGLVGVLQRSFPDRGLAPDPGANNPYIY